MEQGSEIQLADSDFYQRLRSRLSAWFQTKEGKGYRFADQLLLLPDFVHLMIRLSLDARVPFDLRTQTAAVLAYVTLPIDLIPEAMIGPVGFADDLLLVALMTRRLLANVPYEIVLGHWAGPKALIQTMHDLLALADEMVGGRVWKRLQRLIGGDAS